MMDSSRRNKNSVSSHMSRHFSSRSTGYKSSRSPERSSLRKPQSPVSKSSSRIQRRFLSGQRPLLHNESRFSHRPWNDPRSDLKSSSGYKQGFWTSDYDEQRRASGHDFQDRQWMAQGSRWARHPRSKVPNSSHQMISTDDTRYNYRLGSAWSTGHGELSFFQEHQESYSHSRHSGGPPRETCTHKDWLERGSTQKCLLEEDRTRPQRFHNAPSKQSGFEFRYEKQPGDWFDTRKAVSPRHHHVGNAQSRSLSRHKGEKQRQSHELLNCGRKLKRISTPHSGSNLRNSPAKQLKLQPTRQLTRRRSDSQNPRLPGKRFTLLQKEEVTPALSSGHRKSFDCDLRPEDILVTRNYENHSSGRRESSSDSHQEDQRLVKIVRELVHSSSIRSSAGEGEGLSHSNTKSSPSKGDASEISDTPMSDIETPRSLVDAHGDTDERVLSKEKTKTMQQQSKLSYDFGDKDERLRNLDKENFYLTISDGISSSRPTRSESRDDEVPRERFDKKVNIRSPDDLRNSLARRQKQFHLKADEMGNHSRTTSANEIQPLDLNYCPRESAKRRSSGSSSSKSRNRKEPSPKCRRLSEGHHSKYSTFKKPFPMARHSLSYHSFSAHRSRRYSSFALSGIRGGKARVNDDKRSLVFASRGFPGRR